MLRSSHTMIEYPFPREKILRVTIEKRYVVTMVDEKTTNLDNRSIEDIKKEWFEEYRLSDFHTTRDSHVIGEKVIKVEEEGHVVLHMTTPNVEEEGISKSLSTFLNVITPTDGKGQKTQVDRYFHKTAVNQIVELCETFTKDNSGQQDVLDSEWKHEFLVMASGLSDEIRKDLFIELRRKRIEIGGLCCLFCGTELRYEDKVYRCPKCE